MGKNLDWDEYTFNMVDWKVIGAYITKMEETEATNTLKLVHR